MLATEMENIQQTIVINTCAHYAKQVYSNTVRWVKHIRETNPAR